jgi:hypothetical protein
VRKHETAQDEKEIDGENGRGEHRTVVAKQAPAMPADHRKRCDAAKRVERDEGARGLHDQPNSS